MMKGKVTEFAKKKFSEGNRNVDQYLNQMNAQVAQDMQMNGTLKALDQKVSL